MMKVFYWEPLFHKECFLNSLKATRNINAKEEESQQFAHLVLLQFLAFGSAFECITSCLLIRPGQEIATSLDLRSTLLKKVPLKQMVFGSSHDSATCLSKFT